MQGSHHNSTPNTPTKTTAAADGTSSIFDHIPYISEKDALAELLKRPVFYGAVGIGVLWSCLHFGVTLPAFAASLFFALLAAHTLIDARHMILPDSITLPGMALGVAFAPTFLGIGWANSLAGGLLALVLFGGVFLGFYLIRGFFGMGFGDVKLLAMLGLWVGVFNLPVLLLLASFTAFIFFAYLRVVKKQSSQTPIPFGPFLTVAAWLALLYGPIIWLQLLAGHRIVETLFL